MRIKRLGGEGVRGENCFGGLRGVYVLFLQLKCGVFYYKPRRIKIVDLLYTDDDNVIITILFMIQDGLYRVRFLNLKVISSLIFYFISCERVMYRSVRNYKHYCTSYELIITE